MAITTYSELKTALGRWARRPGVMATSDTAAEMIALFEAGANASIRMRDNEITTPIVAVPGVPFIALPSDFQEPVSLKVTADQRDLDYFAPALLPYYPTQGPSYRWTVTDSRIQTERDADQAYAYTLRYHKRFALSATVTTNVLLTKYPNVYLNGALLEAAPYVRDLSVIALWQSRYDRAKAELDKAEIAHKKRATLGVDAALMNRQRTFDINRGW